MAHEVTILDSSAEWLRDKGRNFTSQFGEDGYVSALFERIGIENKWCFEVGANDGTFYSNTKWMRDAEWNAVLIESDERVWEKLKAHASDRVQCINRTVQCQGADSLDAILGHVGAPRDLDFGSIDIDGKDYYIWQWMKIYEPRVMLVEFSPYQSPDYRPEIWAEQGQAGLNPIVALGISKGYVPLLHTYCNVLFVREDVWEAAQ